MRPWRNRHTRTFEGRVQQWVRVQVPSTARKSSADLQGFFPLLFHGKKRSADRASCGELGIRTLGEVSPHTRFPVVRLRPLSQLSTMVGSGCSLGLVYRKKWICQAVFYGILLQKKRAPIMWMINALGGGDEPPFPVSHSVKRK